ncbi:phosphoheptose isomerase [Olivibacter sp. SDN3]|nr:phosphoheptose isomerase [Olivibacter sp. SDN3]
MSNKCDLFEEVKIKLASQGFKVVNQDQNQPWGGSLLIEESQAEKFARIYFSGKDLEQERHRVVKPKILVVAPGKRIAWQYHLRRAEIWQVLVGKVGVVTSDDDVLGAIEHKDAGEWVYLGVSKRHQLVGLHDWGVVAQLWQLPEDGAQPSDEQDVVRLESTKGTYLI